MSKFAEWYLIELALKKDGISKRLINDLKEAYLKNEPIIVENDVDEKFENEIDRTFPDTTVKLRRDFVVRNSNIQNKEIIQDIYSKHKGRSNEPNFGKTGYVFLDSEKLKDEINKISNKEKIEIDQNYLEEYANNFLKSEIKKID